mgnify:CR=1 FL=1
MDVLRERFPAQPCQGADGRGDRRIGQGVQAHVEHMAGPLDLLDRRVLVLAVRVAQPGAEVLLALARQADRLAARLHYGVEANRPSLEAIVDIAYRQGLIPRRFSIEELFSDETRDLS